MTDTPETHRPLTVGDAMRLIGRYTESEGGDSAETVNARRALFDTYLQWCEDGRPEDGYVAPDQQERFLAAVSSALTRRSVGVQS